MEKRKAWNSGLKMPPDWAWNKGLKMPEGWGLRHREKHLGEFGQQSRNQIFQIYKSRAKRILDLEWNLSKEEFRILTQQDCFYCGATPSNVQRARSGNGDYVYNGIDRKLNDVGYTIENCVPCCGRCNLAKRKMTFEEFIAWIKKAYMALQNKGFINS